MHVKIGPNKRGFLTAAAGAQRRVTRAAGIGIGALLLTLGSVAPANATPQRTTAPATGAGDCPTNYVCFWSEPNFQGTQSNYYPYGYHTCGSTPIQPARSIVNNSAYAWDFFDGSTQYCYGPIAHLNPGQNTANTSAWLWA